MAPHPLIRLVLQQTAHRPPQRIVAPRAPHAQQTGAQRIPQAGRVRGGAAERSHCDEGLEQVGLLGKLHPEGDWPKGVTTLPAPLQIELAGPTVQRRGPLNAHWGPFAIHPEGDWLRPPNPLPQLFIFKDLRLEILDSTAELRIKAVSSIPLRSLPRICPTSVMVPWRSPCSGPDSADAIASQGEDPRRSGRYLTNSPAGPCRGLATHSGFRDFVQGRIVLPTF